MVGLYDLTKEGFDRVNRATLTRYLKEGRISEEAFDRALDQAKNEESFGELSESLGHPFMVRFSIDRAKEFYSNHHQPPPTIGEVDHRQLSFNLLMTPHYLLIFFYLRNRWIGLGRNREDAESLAENDLFVKASRWKMGGKPQGSDGPATLEVVNLLRNYLSYEAPTHNARVTTRVNKAILEYATKMAHVMFHLCDMSIATVQSEALFRQLYERELDTKLSRMAELADEMAMDHIHQRYGSPGHTNHRQERLSQSQFPRRYTRRMEDARSKSQREQTRLRTDSEYETVTEDESADDDVVGTDGGTSASTTKIKKSKAKSKLYRKKHKAGAKRRRKR